MIVEPLFHVVLIIVAFAVISIFYWLLVDADSGFDDENEPYG